MNEALKQLLEERDQKAQALQDLIDVAKKEERSQFTDEENESRTKLVEEIKGLDGRLDEETAKAKRSEQLAEARRLAGVGPSVDAKVVDEPKTYGPGSPHSYFYDIARMALPQCNTHSAAASRLARHSYEMAKEVALDTREGRIAAKQYRELTRSPNVEEHRESMRQFRATGESEQRTAGLTTGGGATLSVTGGGGAPLVIPPAFVDDWIPYRAAGRTFLDTIHHETLPEAGMTLYVPNVSGQASVATYDDAGAQTVSETTPTFGMLSAPVVTEAGQVEVTQVMLDRGSVPSDQVIADSLRRALAPVLDLVAINAALSGAGSIVDNSNAWAITKQSGVGGIYGKLSQAKATIRTAAGTFVNPNCAFMQPARWEQIAGASDSTGRPLVVPSGSMGPFNTVATPGGNAGVDVYGANGRTGYQMSGLEVFQDYNIPAPTTGTDQVIVLDSDIVYAYEGAPVPRVLPQTKGNALIVYIQLYEYLAVLPIYPLGVEKLSGTFFGAYSWA